MLQRVPAAIRSPLGRQFRYASSFKKYTLEPTGVWATVKNWLAVDPGRSSGVPLNPQFRNPPPGALDPNTYDDPVTIPAGDIADNPYWKRDVRRRYARLSTIKQGDVVALLTVGSKSSPKQELIGDAGTQALVAVKEEGEKGLATYFKEKQDLSGVLGSDNMPPMPPQYGVNGKSEIAYTLDGEQSYEGKYPCRSFQ